MRRRSGALDVEVHVDFDSVAGVEIGIGAGVRCVCIDDVKFRCPWKGSNGVV